MKSKRHNVRAKKRRHSGLRRKNPFTQRLSEIPLTNDETLNLLYELRDAIVWGYIDHLVAAIQITKIGRSCTDCDEEYLYCTCEKCEDCEMKKCVCRYKFKEGTLEENIRQRNRVRQFSWNFARYLLNSELLNYLKMIIFDYAKLMQISEIEIQNIQKIVNK